jgi:FkbM family methyltransferase
MTGDEPEQIWNFFQRRSRGLFVEVGANDPHFGSQTWLLEQKGWAGILIEPQSRHFKRLSSLRPRSRIFAVACSGPGHVGEAVLYLAQSDGQSGLTPTQFEATYVGKERVPVRTLNEVLVAADVTQIDFVSIDVEGHQIEVLRGFDLAAYRPALLLVEDRFRNWQTHVYLGHRGYRLIKRSGGLNSWYIPRENSFPFKMSERLRLFRFVWLGTPVRAFKFWLREKWPKKDRK